MTKGNLFILLITICLFISCSGDDNNPFPDSPNGQYRVLEKICECYFSPSDFTEYWIFDLESKRMTIIIIDAMGQQVSSEQLYYNTKGRKLYIGDGRVYSQKTVSGVLELTYIDDPVIVDDELIVKLVSY